jgi:hypothetical protein
MTQQHEQHKDRHEQGDDRGHPTVDIVVNGRQKVVHEKEISFEEVVRLAFPTPPTGENIMFTVTYRKARGEQHEGIMAPGQSVKIKEGTAFNVRYTDKS